MVLINLGVSSKGMEQCSTLHVSGEVEITEQSQKKGSEKHNLNSENQTERGVS